MWKEKEYLQLLEDSGIDTVCFMGSGYQFEEYRIGQEFYKPYAYYGKLAKEDVPDALRHVIAMYSEVNMTDKYKLIQKFTFKENKIYGHLQRYDKVLIQNTRTKEIKELRFQSEIDDFSLFLMADDPTNK